MPEFSAEQIQKFADLMSSNPKAQQELNALLGITSKETETPSVQTDKPSSSSKDINSGTLTDDSKDFTKQKKDLDAQPKAEFQAASDILAFVPDFALPRHVEEQDNGFVPNLNGMYALLTDMNSLIAQKFRAQRAHQSFCPYVPLFYLTFCANLQVARCLRFSDQLHKNTDVNALDTFLQRFPAEKFPIPGPILPFLKSITTYKVQNSLVDRVSPCFPNFYIKNDGTHTWYHDSECTQLFPYLPAVAEICSTAVDKIFASANPDPDVIAKPWPLEWKSATAHADTDLVKASTFLGITIPEAALNNFNEDIVRVIVNPATYRTPLYTDTQAKTAKPFRKQLKFPTAPTGQTNFLRVYLMIEDTAWLKVMLKQMTEYSSLWTGSGSLADCSVDGPAFGAYQYTYDQLPASHAAKTKPLPLAFQDVGLFSLQGSCYTTQGSPEPLTEKMASITHIHARLCQTHWDGKNTSNGSRRFGNVWDLRPVYGPSSTTYFYDSSDDYVEGMMKDIYKK